MPNDTPSPLALAREAAERFLVSHADRCAVMQPECHDMTPPGYQGRWRDWHRGHGCHLDMDRPQPACTCGRDAAQRAYREALVRRTIAWLANAARDEDKYPGRFPFLTGREMEEHDPAAVLAEIEKEEG